MNVEKVAAADGFPDKNSFKSPDHAETPTPGFQSVIDAYIAGQPAERQALLFSVRSAISHALPDATEKIAYQMPTFWQGRNLIHFAAQKNHLGIYPGAEAMKHFAPRLTEYRTSKGAIQFPYQSFSDMQAKLITEIATWCKLESAEK